jgi:hypothetical protein
VLRREDDRIVGIFGRPSGRNGEKREREGDTPAASEH